jgi:hypothetical protein
MGFTVLTALQSAQPKVLRSLSGPPTKHRPMMSRQVLRGPASLFKGGGAQRGLEV